MTGPYQMTSGYVGSMGMSWKTVDEATANAALDQAAAFEKMNRAVAAPKPAPVLVKCSCGHSVSHGLVMSASMGSSCPKCYDRMSE